MTTETVSNALKLAPTTTAWSGSISYSFSSRLPSYYSGNTGYFGNTGMPVSYSSATFTSWTATDKAVALSAFRDIELFANVKFADTGVGENSNLVFNALAPSIYDGANPAGGYTIGNETPAYAFVPKSAVLSAAQGPKLAGDLWLSGSFHATSSNPVVKDYFKYVVYHELGHAIGLDHTFEPGVGIGATQTSSEYNNNTKFSIMAYGLHPGEGRRTNDYQIADIATLQKLYGRNDASNAGNSTYRVWDEVVPSTAGGTNARQDRSFAIWDGGGIDTINASAYAGKSAYIDLRPGHFSSIGPEAFSKNASIINSNWTIVVGINVDGSKTLGTENISIAFGAAIENATGGNANDVIVGNMLSNVINGGAGNDLLFGDGFGIDRANAVLLANKRAVTGLAAEIESATRDADYRRIDKGGIGADILATDAATDTLRGGAGDDLIVAGRSNGLLYGQAGNDFLIAADGYSSELHGGNGDDILIGGTSADQLFGGAGSDVFKAYQGNDLIHGGEPFADGATPRVALEKDGIDTYSYADAAASHATNMAGIAILVTDSAILKDVTFVETEDYAAATFVRDLSTDPQYIGSVDTLISIEKIIGTDAADVLNIDSLTGLKLAGADGRGGLREVDLGESAQANLTNFAFANFDPNYATSIGSISFSGPFLVSTRIPVGDTIDLHNLNEAAKVDLSLAAPSVSAKSATDRGLIVYGAENIIGSAYDDILINNVVNGTTYGGDGNDTLYATGSGRSYAFGGTGDDIIYGGKNSSGPDTISELYGMSGADIFNAYIVQDQLTYIKDIEKADRIYVNDILVQGNFVYQYTFDSGNPYAPNQFVEVFIGNGMRISHYYEAYSSSGSSRGISGISIDLLAITGVPRGSIFVTNFIKGDAGLDIPFKFLGRVDNPQTTLGTMLANSLDDSHGDNLLFVTDDTLSPMSFNASSGSDMPDYHHGSRVGLEYLHVEVA